MSLIDGIIPKQAFETARDLIGAILFTELTAQKTRQNFSEPVNVFTGRSTPFNHSEKVMVNVLVDSANYTNNHQAGTHGNTNFFIDIYVSAKEKEDQIGGNASTQLRDKFLGMCRFILQDHHYKTLGLPMNGCVMGTAVDNFENYEPKTNQDAAFVKMSRMTFSVRLNETQSLWDGININTIFTDVKLDLTELGYIYEVIQ